MLKNKKVVLVGGSSGIGYAIAQKALNAGAQIVIASRSSEKLQAAVRVNTACPSFADTDPPTPDRTTYVRTLSPTLPLNRLGTASDIADAYLYLFGSTYSTGTVVVVDGGAIC